MSDHAATLDKRVRTYLLRVVGVIILVPALGWGVLQILAWMGFTSTPVMGSVGVAILLGTVAASLAVHRATVRCPACEKWLVPLGINGVTPGECPHCKVNLG